MRKLSTIATEIRRSWYPVHYAAVPYLQALSNLGSIDENCMNESARSVVRYFLANAGTWRGPDARRIKAELKGML